MECHKRDTLRFRGVLSSFCLVCACALWAWLCLHTTTAFAANWREERELKAEANMLLDNMCSLPRSFPISGSLIKCDEVRAAAPAPPPRRRP
jgi:hypothetical protein